MYYKVHISIAFVMTYFLHHYISDVYCSVFASGTYGKNTTLKGIYFIKVIHTG